MAVVIIGLTAIPLVGMLLETIGGASEHRDLALIDTVLKSFAETAKAELVSSPPAATGSVTKSSSSVTSAGLFSGTADYVGYAISGIGIPATTIITSEPYPNNGTAQLSHTATASSSTEPLTIGYQACATTYHLMSDPSTLSGPGGTPVTVFVTGFQGASLATFRVDIGPATTLTPTATKSTGPDAGGNARITFTVPPSTPPTPATQPPYPITVKAKGVQVSSLPGTGFRVTSTGTPLTTSPDVGYTAGITAVRYWTPKSAAFVPTCTGTSATGGLQVITVSATGPGHVSDHLTVAIRNPVYTAVPRQTPNVTVTGTDVARPSTGSTTLVFTATVTPAATSPTPTQPVTWTVTEPHGTSTTCSATSTSKGAGNSETYTCRFAVTSTSQFGIYTATATYPGDAYNTKASGSGSGGVYAPDGSGSTQVSPTTAVPAKPLTLSFSYTAATLTGVIPGTDLGVVTIDVPAGWTAPQVTNKTAPGYCTATGGATTPAVEITGRTIEVTGVTLTTAHRTLTITYTDATAATGTLSPSHFTAAEASVATVTPVLLNAATTHDTVTLT